MFLFNKLLSILEKAGATVRRNPHLSILLIAAFVLRFSGIFWGLPHFDTGVYHPDEPKIVRGAYNFPSDIMKRSDLRYPTACHYTLGVITWPIRILLQSSGHDAYAFVYLSGRVLSVILGTANILLIYILVRRLFDKKYAFVTASVLAFSMFHVTNSAWATTDVATAFLLTLFLLLLTPTIERQSLSLAISSGITLGFLVGAKYPGVIAILPLFLLTFSYQRSRHQYTPLRQATAFLTDRTLWIVGATSLLVFFLTTPGILLKPEAFLSSIHLERARMAQNQLPLYNIDVWRDFFVQLNRAMGLPLAIAACLGFVVSCASGKAFEIALAVLVGIYFLYFGDALAPRYLIMIMPILAFFAAQALLFFKNSKHQTLSIGSLVISIVVLSHAVWYTSAAALSRYPDTRSTATIYIRENIPEGATIGIAYTSEKYGWKHHIWRYPTIDFDTLNYVDFMNTPEYIVVSSWDAYKIRWALQSGLLAADFTYPMEFADHWYRRSPPTPRIFEFFYNLYFSENPSYELVRKFKPRIWAPIEFPAPVIEIFRQKNKDVPTPDNFR